MFFSAQEASNNQSRETSGLLSIFVHLFVILPYVCFCHLFLLLSLDQRFGPSRPIIEGGNVAAPTRSERASALALSQLTPSGESFDLCSASKQKNKMGIDEAKPEELLSK